MEKIRLMKISGGKSHETSMGVGEAIEGFTVGGMFPTVPTKGRPFVIENYRTSLIEEVLSRDAFRTYNSVYKWEVLYSASPYKKQ